MWEIRHLEDFRQVVDMSGSRVGMGRKLDAGVVVCGEREVVCVDVVERARLQRGLVGTEPAPFSEKSSRVC